MREGWEITKLGAICEIFRGGSPRPIKSFITQEADGVNWIKIGDTEVGGKYIYSTEEKIRREGMRSSRYVEPGDFLLSNSMSFGRPYILKTDGCIHDGWLVIKKYDRTLIQDFLYYLLLSPVVARQFEEGARGSTVRNLNTDIVSNVVVSYPVSHIEQQRIVDILDREFAKIEALKANAEKSLQAAKDLFQATLKKELAPKEGWRTEPFGDVCQYYKEQGLFPSLRYVGMENIEAESGTLLGTMSGEQVQSSSFHFYPGDVLYGRLRPYLKKVVVADFEGCCSTEIFPVRSKECIPGFLQYWFLADDTTKKINATCSGCRMPRANMKDVLSFEISFPGKKEQEEVVQRIKTLCDNAKSLQQNYQKTLTLCDDWKQSLLRKAFNGEL